MDILFHKAQPLGSVQLSFPGPAGGYTFLHIPTEETREAWHGKFTHDTLVEDHAYLLDLNVSGDGLYLAPDTMLSFSSTTPFVFKLQNGHAIHANMTPGHSHEDMRRYDTSFNGTIGYGLIKEFVTAFDFRKNTLTFYPLYSLDSIPDSDTNVLQLPIIDDAKITYCGCNQPTIWLDVNAPPFPRGHVNLAFQDPQSEIFRPALDSATGLNVDLAHRKDSLAGLKRPIGIHITHFFTRDVFGSSIDFASYGTARYIEGMPPIYHDFNVPVLGALGTDVLRTFRGIIIDPSRNRLIFVK
ncbi:MAG TPA: hypothetical protein VGM92_13660 [Candidatus Kapabacteria bacterium]